MKLVMRRLSHVLAAAAGVAFVASFGIAASAAEYGPGYRYQPQPSLDVRTPVAPETGVAPSAQAPGNNCFYTNYDPSSSLGQGSGHSLGNSRLVCE